MKYSEGEILCSLDKRMKIQIKEQYPQGTRGYSTYYKVLITYNIKGNFDEFNFLHLYEDFIDSVFRRCLLDLEWE